MQRYFVKENIDGSTFTLPPEIFHHAIDVMRGKVSDKIEIVGPDQKIKLVELIAVESKSAEGKVIDISTQDPELPVEVTIVCGISKGDKIEKIVQKGTELGAKRFVLYNAARSVAKWDEKKAPKKLSRLQKIAKGAAEQSHRTVIPEVLFCQKLSDVLELTAESDRQIVAYEESAKQGETGQLAQVLQETKCNVNVQGSSVSLTGFFGPEGGFAPDEIQALNQQQVVSVGLGPRIMRAETAPLYLLAALSFVLELE